MKKKQQGTVFKVQKSRNLKSPSESEQYKRQQNPKQNGEDF